MIGEIFGMIRDFLAALLHFYTGPAVIVLTPLVTTLLIGYLYFKVIFKNVEGFETDAENVGRVPLYNKDYYFADALMSLGKIYLWVIISVVCACRAYPQAAVWFPHWFAH